MLQLKGGALLKEVMLCAFPACSLELTATHSVACSACRPLDDGEDTDDEESGDGKAVRI